MLDDNTSVRDDFECKTVIAEGDWAMRFHHTELSALTPMTNIDALAIEDQARQTPRLANGSNPPEHSTVIDRATPHADGDDAEAHPRQRFEDTELRVEETQLRPSTRPMGPHCAVELPELDTYRIIRRIAVGGMGIVFEATHRTTEQRVALKYMRKQSAQSPALVRRFLAEAVAASRIDHPGVPPIYDYGHDDNGIPYLVMEYLDGESLESGSRAGL